MTLASRKRWEQRQAARDDVAGLRLNDRERRLQRGMGFKSHTPDDICVERRDEQQTGPAERVSP